MNVNKGAMANKKQVKRLKRSVERWNAWRKKHWEVVVDLREADLTGANLNGANLNGANLAEADLTWANLKGADLYGADLSLAKLIWANLKGADLEEALLFGTVFADTNLTETKGLKRCRHLGPSSLDHLTLANTPHIPDRFLRGCGLSDWQIESAKLNRTGLTDYQITDIAYRIHDLRAQGAIQIYDCYISYASPDEDFARRLHDDLQEAGVRCWFAPEKMKGGWFALEKMKGDRKYTQLKDVICLHDKLLLILSEHSIESHWAAFEIKQARAREKEKGCQMLFPLGRIEYDRLEAWELFDERTKTDLAAEVRAYHIPDFTNPDTYKESFDRLLTDLREGA